MGQDVTVQTCRGDPSPAASIPLPSIAFEALAEVVGKCRLAQTIRAPALLGGSTRGQDQDASLPDWDSPHLLGQTVVGGVTEDTKVPVAVDLCEIEGQDRRRAGFRWRPS